MCRAVPAKDDRPVLSRPALTAVVLLVAAVLVTGAMAWPRTAKDGGPVPLEAEAPSATTRAAVAPPVTPTTAAQRGLDPGLVAAFDRGVAAARRAGHKLSVTSGYRTAAEQEALLTEAISERGYREAYRWVFPPARSMHVRGLAVDVGDKGAAAWLDHHGSRFGLCRTLAWEWWHFEWRSAWEASSSCPEPADDPADAPT
jgi:D-alanyl-D-alanine carboxypeptidase